MMMIIKVFVRVAVVAQRGAVAAAADGAGWLGSQWQSAGHRQTCLCHMARVELSISVYASVRAPVLSVCERIGGWRGFGSRRCGYFDLRNRRFHAYASLYPRVLHPHQNLCRLSTLHTDTARRVGMSTGLVFKASLVCQILSAPALLAV
jgi:hypothetical protein